MNWNEITFEQYLAINEINEREDDLFNKILDTIAVLKDIDVNEITINNYKDYTQEITFLNTDIPIVPLKDEYGEYTLHKDLSSMSMKQYIDFNNYAKTNDYVGVLSVFLYPKGKQYNEGYDIDKVRQYILTMSCVDVLSIYTFFLMQCNVYMECSRIYLKQQQKMILTKRKKERRKQMNWMEIYRLYRRYVACLIYHTYKSWIYRT